MYDGSARPWINAPQQPPAPQPKQSFAGSIPHPPPLNGGALTVDDAWALFGVAKKRATRDEVKRRYLAFVSLHHPDKHPGDEIEKTAQLARANAAWSLLQRHCKW